MFKYIKFLYYKFKHRKTFGPWMKWSLDKKTKTEILTNGFWENSKMLNVEFIDVEKSETLDV